MRRVLKSLVGGMLVMLLVQSPALMAAPPAAASAPAMGVILQAQRANVGDGTAMTGSSVFDGDLLQTEKDGLLRVRFGASQAALMSGAAAVVHQSADGFSANLTRGEAVLSSGQGQKFSLVSDGATIEPSTSGPTVAQVTWVSSKELLVMSRRGALQVSLGDQVQTIADGASYRMVIDPVAAAAAGKPAPHPMPQRGATASGSNTFLLILLGSAAAAITVGVILAVESPSAL